MYYKLKHQHQLPTHTYNQRNCWKLMLKKLLHAFLNEQSWDMIKWHTGNSITWGWINHGSPPPKLWCPTKNSDKACELTLVCWYYVTVACQDTGVSQKNRLGGVLLGSSHWLCPWLVFRNYCILLLQYHTSTRLDNICWMTSLFPNTGCLFN